MSAFEVRCNRVVNVYRRLAPIISETITILAALEANPSLDGGKFGNLRHSLVESFVDVFEVMDGLSGTVRDLGEYHVETFKQVNQQVQELRESLDKVKRMIE